MLSLVGDRGTLQYICLLGMSTLSTPFAGVRVTLELFYTQWVDASFVRWK